MVNVFWINCAFEGVVWRRAKHEICAAARLHYLCEHCGILLRTAHVASMVHDVEVKILWVVSLSDTLALKGVLAQ